MSEVDFVVCVRNVRRQGGRQVFGAEPGRARFLAVPRRQYPRPEHAQRVAGWETAVLRAARDGSTEPEAPGDILFFVHGYNNDQKIVMQRHRRLARDLRAAGFRGVVVSFDWPSDDKVLNYLEDRDDAKATAHHLRDDCIARFVRARRGECTVNVHLLGHSTGAYVIREAFTAADEKRSIRDRVPWTVSQIALIAADISSRSLRADDGRSRSLHRHCVRLTNYQNPYDAVLKLSNVKRFGNAPRAGRVGLPEGHHAKAVNVDCGAYFASLDEDALEEGRDYFGSFSHSWHIGDPVFAEDLACTLAGDVDRHWIRTRERTPQGLVLRRPPPGAGSAQ